MEGPRDSGNHFHPFSVVVRDLPSSNTVQSDGVACEDVLLVPEVVAFNGEETIRALTVENPDYHFNSNTMASKRWKSSKTPINSQKLTNRSQVWQSWVIIRT